MNRLLTRLFYLPLLITLRWRQSDLRVRIEDAQYDLFYTCEHLPYELQAKQTKRLESLLEQQADIETKICQFWDNR